jgi:hypothetical protein
MEMTQTELKRWQQLQQKKYFRGRPPLYSEDGKLAQFEGDKHKYLVLQHVRNGVLKRQFVKIKGEDNV